MPLVVWLVCYVFLLRYFIPRLGKVAAEQADTRSMMTGRVVDSYTNIQTVKLFSHAQREASYAREGMSEFLQTVHRSMRLVTGLYGLLYVMNSLLLFSVSALSIWLWLGDAVTIGAVAVVIGLVLRLWGMSQWIMWEVSALFENIGTVQDGIGSISLPRLVEDRPGAKDIVVTKGDIAFDRIGFHYGKGKGVIEEPLADGASRARRSASSAARAPASRRWSTCSALLRPRERPHPDRRAGHRRGDAGQPARADRHGDAGHLAAAPLGARQHPLRPARRDRGDDGRGGQARRSDRFRRQPGRSEGPPGLRRACRRARRQAVGRPAAARRDCPRVMLKDAPILILDEATSALDSEAEAAIQENLYRLMEGKTVIAIAHRLSTIAAMDRLVVMDGGHIVEEGPHDVLVAKGGLYAQLWQRQSGGFLLDDGQARRNRKRPKRLLRNERRRFSGKTVGTVRGRDRRVPGHRPRGAAEGCVAVHPLFRGAGEDTLSSCSW